MKTFLQHAKELEREELERQMHRHFEMAQKSLATAQQLEMAGDMDGYKTFMAKHHHFQTQGDYLKNALNESFANDFLAMAKKRVPSAEIKSSEQRRKETDALMKQRQAAAANRPKQSSGGAGEKYPLGGYDAKSGRSYSEEVENVVEMDKTQTPPGRDGDIDWTKKQIHLGPERMMKAKDVAKHALKALDKTMKKSTPEKKGVAEGFSDVVKGIKRSIKGKEHPDVVASKHAGRAIGHYNQGNIAAGDKETERYVKTRDMHLKAKGVAEEVELDEAKDDYHYTDEKGNKYRYGASGYVGVVNKSGINQGQQHISSLSSVHKKNYEKLYGKQVKKEEVELDEVAAWQRKEGKNPTGGLNRKGIASYRRENPGSKLSMAVTTKPSKLKKGSKAWNRRKSFCARMGGMPGPMKDEKGRPTRKALSLRKWNC